MKTLPKPFSQPKTQIFILFILLSLTPSECFISFRTYSHFRWTDQDRKLSEITDITWNYCDVKCTYLQVLFPQYDFVVMNFKEKKSGDRFGVCYIKSGEEYFLWNELVRNQFYKRICGKGDDEQFLKDENKYEMVSVLGVGKGTQLPVKYSHL